VASAVTVRGKEFASKAALERYCRTIIERYGDGEVMRDEDGMFFLSLILERHDCPQDKIIIGLEDEVIGVRVRHNSGYRLYGASETNVNHLFVAYAGGFERDFSWKKCCLGFRPEAVATGAMRRAVWEQVAAYKKLRFLAGSVTSDSSGEPLDWSSARVDHYPKTFAWMRDTFLTKEGLSLADVATKSDPEVGVSMADDCLRERWAVYHDATKTLRLVSVRENETSWREEGAMR
jgi:hypothetical protein